MRFWLLAIALAAALGPGRPRSPLDRATTRVWPAKQAWSDSLEAEYGELVEALGRAVEARRCSRLDECLGLPEANPLHDPEIDADLHLEVDCADLPYVLRAYFAFKRQLPFGYVAAATGEGLDIRYAVDVKPTAWKTWLSSPTPRAFLRQLTEDVHTGMYRITGHVPAGDFYPVRVDRASIRPGTIFYDPLGHVSLVARVGDDGEMGFLEGTPKGLLIWRRFDKVYNIGTARVGGGFKRFRPQRLEGGRLVREDPFLLADFDPFSQHDAHFEGDRKLSFAEWVAARLSDGGAAEDATVHFRRRVGDVCRELADRAALVELARRDGVARRPHPPELPANIYGADGVWEAYSTPARDARLRAAFRGLFEEVSALEDLPALAPALRAAWAAEAAAPSCRIVYRDSRGQLVSLGLDDVVDRLFDLSFDPYHCPELRWGAPPGSAERASCSDGRRGLAWYEAERRLRLRTDRGGGEPTGLGDGPTRPPPSDVRTLIDGPPLEL